MTVFEKATLSELNEEINRIPPEYLGNVLKLLRVFRESVELSSAGVEEFNRSRRDEFFDKLESIQQRAGLDFEDAQQIVSEAVTAVRADNN